MTRANPLRDLAQRFATLADGIEANAGAADEIALLANAALARELYRLRRQRERCFGPELFAEPAWDMLLELHAADCEARTVSTTSLCLASGVPTTTALRYIVLLERAGLIVREPSAGDNRVVLVGLSAEGRDRMHELIGGCFVAGRAAVG